MTNDDDEMVCAAPYDAPSSDPIADRVDAFGLLAERLDTIKNKDIQALGLKMLARVILTIKAPRGELVALQGGKQDATKV